MFMKYFWMIFMGFALFLLAGSFPGALAHKDAPHETRSAENASEILQKTCPVMEGNKIDPKIFTEYKGEKVYFCCPSCKAAFSENPEKYLDRLPQFSSPAHHEEGHTHDLSVGGNKSMSLENILLILVKPFGIATLTLLIATACVGYFMRRKPKVLFKWHKRLAYTTVVMAGSHAVLVFLTH